MNTEQKGAWTQKWMLRPVTNCCRGSSTVRVAPALQEDKMRITKSQLRAMIREVTLTASPGPGGLPFSWPTGRHEAPSSDEIIVDVPRIQQQIQDILDEWHPETGEGKKYENDIENLLNDIGSLTHE